jgi:hypothetical protein
MAANLEDYTVTTARKGDIIETTIYIDLTGVSSTTTDQDIIGAAGACHIGQVTTAVTGNVFAGEVHCVEVPAGGQTDINLSSSSVATGAFDADATGLTDAEAIMTAGGAHAVGTVKPFTVIPTDDYYLYLSAGAAGTAAAYTAGKLVIKMLGRTTDL